MESPPHPMPEPDSLVWQMMARQRTGIWRLGDVFIKCISHDVSRIGLPAGRQWAARELGELARERFVPRWPRPEVLDALEHALRESTDERVAVAEHRALAWTYLRRLRALIELDALAGRWVDEDYRNLLIEWLRRRPGSERRQVARELARQWVQDMHLEQAKRILKRGMEGRGNKPGAE